MTLDERLSEASERFENPEPQIAAAVAEFCKNPYWREYYEKATCLTTSVCLPMTA